mmetsp:Transcript_31435/g.93574  ORF Transcript_31435/g.93574 Transcript_31435/m.93574 type:complete len:323 (+) Transcript_31435:256-1224(+)
MPRDCPATSADMAPTATRTSRKFSDQMEARTSTSWGATSRRRASRHWAPWAAREGSRVTAKGSEPEETLSGGSSAGSRDSASSWPSLMRTTRALVPSSPAMLSRSRSLATTACAPTSAAARAATSANGASSATTQQGFCADMLLASSRHLRTSSQQPARIASTAATWSSSARQVVLGSLSCVASCPTASQTPRGSGGTGRHLRLRNCRLGGASRAARPRPSTRQTAPPDASSTSRSSRPPSARRADARLGALAGAPALALRVSLRIAWGTPLAPRGCSIADRCMAASSAAGCTAQGPPGSSGRSHRACEPSLATLAVRNDGP